MSIIDHPTVQQLSGRISKFREAKQLAKDGIHYVTNPVSFEKRYKAINTAFYESRNEDDRKRLNDLSTAFFKGILELLDEQEAPYCKKLLEKLQEEQRDQDESIQNT